MILADSDYVEHAMRLAHTTVTWSSVVVLKQMVIVVVAIASAETAEPVNILRLGRN